MKKSLEKFSWPTTVFSLCFPFCFPSSSLTTTMKKSYAPFSTLPDDILFKILYLLPLKSLHILKWVSKSWYSLITHQIFPKILQTQFMGFFYNTSFYYNRNDMFTYLDPNNNIIDPRLSFLPCHSNLLILDCRCGLLLCKKFHYPSAHYVCNPVTKSWAEIPSIDSDLIEHSMLDYDPWISPHYKIVAFSMLEGESSVSIHVYRSEVGRWDRRKRLDRCSYIFFRIHYRALWDGAVYVYSPDSFEDRCVTMRFGFLEGDVDHELIEFPMETKPRGMTYIGRFRDRLRLAVLDIQQLQLRVWTLRGKHENEWVLEHNSSLCSLSGYDPRDFSRIVGFHPLRNALLILLKRVVFAYDLEEMSLDEICWIGLEGHENDLNSVVPFSPCSSDLSENRNDHERRN